MKKILVIGDRCTDRFVYGECKRLCPEAPVPVFIPTHTVENGGMAENVARNLQAIAKDYEVIIEFQPNLITKTRYVDVKSNHMFLRVDEGEKGVKPLVVDENIKRSIREAEAVIVSDYNKGFISLDVINYVAENAKMTFVDSKKKLPVSLIEKLTFIKMNETEYESYENSLVKVLNKVIITLGSKGARYRETLYPTPCPKETIDVSGAGDTFLAAFTYYYLETRTESASIRYANEMSAKVVSKKGVVTP
jgi:D-beta-D-heptose 7-phosphate kinase/D-beta-D-heptose 1-phosphate adenosyltransferase